MSNESEPLKPQPLSAIAPTDWFSNPAESSVWLRLYTSLNLPRDQFASRVSAFVPHREGADRFLQIDDRVLLAWGFVQGLKVPTAHFEMRAQDTGQTFCEVKLDQRELPDTTYIFLATPLQIDGVPGSEARARNVLDTAAGLLTLHGGINFMWQVFFEGEVHATTGTISVPSSFVRMPQPEEGPFLHPDLGADLAAVSTRLAYASDPKKSRLRLAIQLMNMAMRKDHGFFEYWTALEVVCDGKSPRIRGRLASLYGFANHKEAGEATRFDVIAGWRHDYVHKGKRPPTTPGTERYLQLMFLDLIRAELDLPPRRYIAAIQGADGYDLSPLGLANRRPQRPPASSEPATAGSEKADG